MLEEGFQVDRSYWPLAQLLCEVLFEIGDADEYKRIASHVRAHDPLCPSLRVLDAKRAAQATATSSHCSTTITHCPVTSIPPPRVRKLEKRARAALAHLDAIAQDAAKRRRVLFDDATLALQTRSRAVEFLLERTSWHSLGQLLLQVHDDLSAESAQSASLAPVRITVTDVSDDAEPRPGASDVTAATDVAQVIAIVDTEDGDDGKDTSSAQAPPLEDGASQSEAPVSRTSKRKKRTASVSEPPTAVAPTTAPSDNDTQDSGLAMSELDEPLLPTRRKSRRHEERLREEHAAAAKLAREKNLGYRLQAFLPENWSRQITAAASASTAIGRSPEKLATWSESCVLALRGAAFEISDPSSAAVLHALPLLAAPGNDAVGCEHSSERSLVHDDADTGSSSTAAAESAAQTISKSQVAAFVARVSTRARSAAALLTLYLNQCGAWAERRLGEAGDRESDEIHAVCFWAEKLLESDSDKRTQRSVTAVATATARGLSPLAKLLLLELKFDKLIRQTALGKRRKRHLQHLNALIASADSLLLELCMSDDDNERPSGDLEDNENGMTTTVMDTGLVRLFWLLARLHERCGRANAAKEYFVKCQDALLTATRPSKDDSAEPSGSAAASSVTITLPNQTVDACISLDVLSAKITGLQYTDVCAEARRCFAAESYDHAVTLLLEHFFPAKQPPRIVDLLREFEATDASDASKDRRLIDILVESFTKSAAYSDDDALLFLVTLLFHVTAFIESLGEQSAVTGALHSEQILESGLSAVTFLVNQLHANVANRVVATTHRELLRACCLLCLKPSLLLLFDSPKDVFQSICAVVAPLYKAVPAPDAHPENTPVSSMIVDAVAHTLHTIRSLDEAAFRELFAKLPTLVHKKKQASRRDRVRALVVELLRFLNWSLRLCGAAATDDGRVMAIEDAHKRSVLLLHCRTLMKDEEDVIARREDKTARQLFGNAAILFLQLCAATHSRETLTDLVALLHARMGQYGICGLCYSDDAASDASERSCFLETSIVVLSAAASSDGDSSDSHATDDSPLNRELAQCYHCLYDVQLLPGCDDHKTGNALALLQRESPTKRADALRLAQFAIPMLLARPPKNNSQKKENVRVLSALRSALHATDAVASTERRNDALETFLAPSRLLEWTDALPVMQDDSADAAAPLDHLSYLLGENYILSRVRRRGNTAELMELETRVKERVAFLITDVLQYRPGRIQSWVRLGKTMKELYHATSDACAVVLGRRRKIAALLAYTKQRTGDVSSLPARLSFHDVVLRASLFATMRQWDERDAAEQDAFRVTLGTGDAAQLVSMEEYAIYYIVQVIEFARRCFAMAAHLADAAMNKKLTARAHDTSDRLQDERELDELRTIVVESNEESGLLLYNVLQELSVLHHGHATQCATRAFPDALYHRVATTALAYFDKGLDVCAGGANADEVRFRLSFMCGKTLKKQLRRQQRALSDEPNEAQKSVTPSDVIACFARAETAHEDGEMEHALVHAFYALQAMRMEVVLAAPVRVDALRLVCDHYFEEEEEEEDEDSASGADDHDSGHDGDDDDTGNESSESRSADAPRSNGKKLSPSTSSDRPLKVTKDDVFALLARAEAPDTADSDVALHAARGWLYLNVIDALESIPNEDRYFHPSRFVLAQGVYRMHELAAPAAFRASDDPLVRALVTALHDRLSAVTVSPDRSPAADPTTSAAAERALKELVPLFDKKRPQIVAIWLSEHVPTAKKFEELNQRQMKYDRYRLKYWRLYIALLEESGAYAKLKEVASWVLACKEEHDVIDEMLGMALRARGSVLRQRTLEFCVSDAPVAATEAVVSDSSSGHDPHTTALLKLLAKTYTFYVDAGEAQVRLTGVLDTRCDDLVPSSELLLVHLFVLGATEFPSAFGLERDAQLSTWRSLATQISAWLTAPTCGASEAVDTTSAEWRALLDTTRAFCEDKWPERMGRSKQIAKTRVRVRAASGSSSSTSHSAAPVEPPAPAPAALVSTQPASVDTPVVGTTYEQ